MYRADDGGIEGRTSEVSSDALNRCNREIWTLDGNIIHYIVDIDEVF